MSHVKSFGVIKDAETLEQLRALTMYGSMRHWEFPKDGFGVLKYGRDERYGRILDGKVEFAETLAGIVKSGAQIYRGVEDNADGAYGEFVYSNLNLKDLQKAIKQAFLRDIAQTGPEV